MQVLATDWPILCCVQISECRPEDLDLLGAAMPSASPRAHYLRFERQLAGQSTVLIAWVDGVPAGHAEIRWDGNDVGDPFPHCPQVNAMEVWPGELRSQGIGTALVAEAERRAVSRGLDQIGLGVADSNRRAAALYLRLGFRETGCRFFDHHEIRDGNRTRWVSEPCRFLVKTLG
jgi:GNAT superfamily N-acetyltransferase